METHKIRYYATDLGSEDYGEDIFEDISDIDELLAALNYLIEEGDPGEFYTARYLVEVGYVPDVLHTLYFKTTEYVSKIELFEWDVLTSDWRLIATIIIDRTMIIDGISVGKSERIFIGVSTDKTIHISETGPALGETLDTKGLEFIPFGENCLINANKNEYPMLIFNRDEDSLLADSGDFCVADYITRTDTYEGNIRKLIPLGQIHTDVHAFCILFENDKGLLIVQVNLTIPGDPSYTFNRIDNIFERNIIDIVGDYNEGEYANNGPTLVRNIYATAQDPETMRYVFRKIQLYPDVVFNPTLVNTKIKISFNGHMDSQLGTLSSIMATNDKIFIGFSYRNIYGPLSITGFRRTFDEEFAQEFLLDEHDLLFSFKKEYFELFLPIDVETIDLSHNNDPNAEGQVFNSSLLPFNPLVRTKFSLRLQILAGHASFHTNGDFGTTHYIEHPYRRDGKIDAFLPAEEGDPFLRWYNSLGGWILYTTRYFAGELDFETAPVDWRTFLTSNRVGISSYDSFGANESGEDFRLYHTGQLKLIDYLNNVVGVYGFCNEGRTCIFPSRVTQGSLWPNVILSSHNDVLPVEQYAHAGRLQVNLAESESNYLNFHIRTRHGNGNTNLYSDRHITRDFLMVWNGISREGPPAGLFLARLDTLDPVTLPAYAQQFVPIKFFDAQASDGFCFRSVLPLVIDFDGEEEPPINRHNVRIFSAKDMRSGIHGTVPARTLSMFGSHANNTLARCSNEIIGNTFCDESHQICNNYLPNILRQVSLDLISSISPLVNLPEGAMSVAKIAPCHYGDIMYTGYEGITYGEFDPDQLDNFDDHEYLYRMENILHFIEEISGVTVNFEEAATYRYKIAYVYDGFQEGPLSNNYLSVTISGPDTEFVHLMVSISEIYRKILNPRITHVSVYATKLVGSEEGELYSLVRSIELSKKQMETTIHGTLRYRFYDNGDRLGAFEALNGYSETLEEVSVRRNCHAICSGYLFVGDCITGSLTSPSVENIIIRSQPGKYSIFDYSRNFLMLPFRPIVMTNYQNKLYVFGKDMFCIVDPENLGIEYSSKVIGAEEKEHLLIMEELLFVYYKGSIYMFSGQKIEKISTPIEKYENSVYGITEEEGIDKMLFSAKRNALCVFTTRPGGEERTKKPTIYIYGLEYRLWSIMYTTEMRGDFLGVYNDYDGDVRVIYDEAGVNKDFSLFMDNADPMLARIEYLLPTNVPESRMYLYGYNSFEPIYSFTLQRTGSPVVTIPHYDTQTKIACEGGRITLAFENVIKNVTLYIRRLLAYAKP